MRTDRESTRWALVVGAVLSMAAAGAAFAGGKITTYYVDSNAPSPGDGSEASPFQSLGMMVSALTRGPLDNVHIRLKRGSVWREPGLILNGLSNSVIEDYGDPSDDPPRMRGDVILSSFIEAAPGQRYTADIHFDPSSLVEDWDVRIDGRGRHYGHLVERASIAAVESTPGSWHGESLGGGMWRLHVHASTNDDPNTNGKAYAVCRSGNAMLIGTPVNLLIRGIDFVLWPDWAGAGYGILVAQGTSTVIERCRSLDTGYHGFGFAGGGATNCVFRDCEVRGIRTSGTTYVFFSFLTDVVGCRAYNCISHRYALLSHDGTVLPNAPGQLPGFLCSGFFQHSVQPAIIRDVEYHGCVDIGYEVHGAPFSGDFFMATPTDKDDGRTYPVRYYDCEVRDGQGCVTGTASWLAFFRCSFDFSDYVNHPTSQFGCVMNNLGNPGVERGIYMEHCVLTADLGNGFASMFRTSGNTRLVLNNVIAYNHAGTTGLDESMFSQHSAPVGSLIRARQCVFSHRAGFNKRMMSGDTAIPGNSPLRDFEDCWYVNMAQGFWSQHGDVNTQAEWAALIDPAGIYGTDPGFAGVPFNLEGVDGGALASIILFRKQMAGSIGINQRPYDGRYGAYQYGTMTLADLNNDGIVNGLDLGILLFNWSIPPGAPACGGADPCAFDLNGDGVVNGLDLGILLANWTI